MTGRVKGRLTFANVMSVIAVFLALGGSAVAVTRIDSNSVRSKQVKNNSLKNKDLADDTVQGNKVDESTLIGVEAGNVTAFHVNVPPETPAPCTPDTPAPSGVSFSNPGGTGSCTITFPQSVFDCAVIATPDQRKIQNVPSTLLQETAQVFRSDEAPREVLVSSIRNGSLADRGFSLAVIC